MDSETRTPAKFSAATSTTVYVYLGDDAFDVETRDGHFLVTFVRAVLHAPRDVGGMYYARGRMYLKSGSLGIVDRNVYINQADLPTALREFILDQYGSVESGELSL